MRWPIRNQIFVPFAALLVASVLLVALVAAHIAVQQSRQQKLSHMHTVTSALGDSSFPLTQDVAARIGAMIGGEVIVADATGKIVASTMQLGSLPPELQGLKSATHEVTQSVRISGREYFVTAIPRVRVPRPGPLFVLLPQDDLLTLRHDALMPPLLVAVPTVLIALVVALWISQGFARRVVRLQKLFGELSEGRHPTVETGSRNDEFRELLVSANDLSTRLKQLQVELRKSERLELLGQLSGGLAHQLRNSITGARLAVQLHQQHCSVDRNEMLATAVSQLRLTEEQVLAVLSLGDGELGHAELEVVCLSTILEDVRHLLRPQSTHWKTEVNIATPVDGLNVSLRAPSAVKGALLNLVLNAVEAAGADGAVQICLSTDASTAVIEIKDDGPGFCSDFETLSDAFRTTKPEGIGLGLSIAQHAVSQENGSLVIHRQEGWTIVRIEFPGVVVPGREGVAV